MLTASEVNDFRSLSNIVKSSFFVREHLLQLSIKLFFLVVCIKHTDTEVVDGSKCADPLQIYRKFFTKRGYSSEDRCRSGFVDVVKE